jgi:formylglycine-generating enzyme required for sulfatase activity
VTVGRFRQFVTAWNNGAGYEPPGGSGKHTHLNGGQGVMNAVVDAGVVYETGWVAADDAYISPTNANLTSFGIDSTWTAAPANQENLPISCVNWYEAYAFCIWDGGFLPSEAEWEYAGAGGSEQREYPWGSTDPGNANRYAIWGCYYPSGAGTCTDVSNIAPVGTATLGAGLWGQMDIAGELGQWSLDWYAPGYVDPCTDCAYLTATSGRMFKGEYFASSAAFPNGLSAANRGSAQSPSYRQNGIGFRCARTP